VIARVAERLGETSRDFARLGETAGEGGGGGGVAPNEIKSQLLRGSFSPPSPPLPGKFVEEDPVLDLILSQMNPVALLYTWCRYL